MKTTIRHIAIVLTCVACASAASAQPQDSPTPAPAVRQQPRQQRAPQRALQRRGTLAPGETSEAFTHVARLEQGGTFELRNLTGGEVVITGGPGVIEGDVVGLDRGTNEDVDPRGPVRNAGPDIGDSNLDSDSDAVGTGEHRTAGRDPLVRSDSDRSPDRVESMPAGLTGSESSGLATDRGGGSTGSGRRGTEGAV